MHNAGGVFVCDIKVSESTSSIGDHKILHRAAISIQARHRAGLVALVWTTVGVGHTLWMWGIRFGLCHRATQR